MIAEDEDCAANLAEDLAKDLAKDLDEDLAANLVNAEENHAADSLIF